MKAKHFKKLRATCQWYDVDTTYSLFGRFFTTWSGIRVLARSHREACFRAKRRGYGLNLSVNESTTTQNWAKWRVKLSSKSEHFKNVFYF